MSLSRKTLCLWIFFSCIILQECKGEETKRYGPPAQCDKVDCPSFTIIHGEKEFEIRNYSQSLWVTAPSVVEYSLMGGLGKAEDDLSNYFFHNNDQGVNIVTAGPLVMMDVLNSTYTVYFYVPHKYQNGGLPTPLASNIKQVNLPKYKYAVARRVDDEISDENVEVQVDVLRKKLKGTAYERAAERDQFTFILYDEGTFTEGYEVLIWFD